MATITRSAARQGRGQESGNAGVVPSRVDPATARPFTLEQELEPFGHWVGGPIWVPPKDASSAMAETMLGRSSLFDSKQKSWAAVVEQHRASFTQVREIELHEASIRLPKGKLFVTVLPQDRFHEITDAVPACVRTRLDEFLDGPGKQAGVKVYYLKPLCVEYGDELMLTSRQDLMAAITQVQDEVFAEYRRLYRRRLPQIALVTAANLALTIPRIVLSYRMRRRQRAVEAYQARLEFERRKTALRAKRVHGRCRTNGCSFDDMLALTNPLKPRDVIEQYSIEQQLSQAKRNQLFQLAAGGVPWFVSLAISVSWVAKVALSLGTLLAPPVLVCDPVFVAEMPDSRGTLLKIGHFDIVGGVMHVEI